MNFDRHLRAELARKQSKHEYDLGLCVKRKVEGRPGNNWQIGTKKVRVRAENRGQAGKYPTWAKPWNSKKSSSPSGKSRADRKKTLDLEKKSETNMSQPDSENPIMASLASSASSASFSSPTSASSSHPPIWEAVALVSELVTDQETAKLFMIWLQMYWFVRRQDPYLLPQDIIPIIRDEFDRNRHHIINNVLDYHQQETNILR